MINKRNIKLINTEKISYIETRNETIMDYAVKYLKEKQLNERIISRLNHMRSFKQIYLPCELVRLTSQKATKAIEDVYAKSCLKWKISFNTIPKPSKKINTILDRFYCMVNELRNCCNIRF